MPEGQWKFDAEVAASFDDMLRRSIPQYDVMRDACYDVGRHYVKPKTDIVDLGCSRGAAIDRFTRAYGAQVRYVGVDVSEPMLEAARQRLRGFIDCGIASIERVDLRTSYPYCQASLTLCVLTLQFTPIEYRQHILQRIHDHTLPGGALVIVEKVLGYSAPIDDVLVDVYYDFKRRNGYSEDAIQRKRLSLEGVLVPQTAEANERMLQRAGFHQVECFWRWSNFAGWLAVRP